MGLVEKSMHSRFPDASARADAEGLRRGDAVVHDLVAGVVQVGLEPALGPEDVRVLEVEAGAGGGVPVRADPCLKWFARHSISYCSVVSKGDGHSPPLG